MKNPKMTLANVRAGRIRAPLRELLYGAPGIGKSTWAASAPAPIFLETEEGSKNLDVARFPLAESWGDVLDAVDSLVTDRHAFQTLVIDGLDGAEPLVNRWVCQKHNADSIEDVKGGFGKGYVLALEEWRDLLAGLEHLQRARAMNVVLLAHAEIKAFRNPAGDDFDRYQLRMHAKAAALLTAWAESVLFASEDVRVKKGKQVGTPARFLYTTRAAGFDAKCRYGLPPRIPLDFAEFARLVEAGMPADEGVRKEIEEGIARLEAAVAKKACEALGRAGSDPAKLRQLAGWLRAKLEEAEEAKAAAPAHGPTSSDETKAQPPAEAPRG